MRARRRWRFAASGALALLVFGLALSRIDAEGPAGGVRAKFRTGNTVLVPAGETVPHDLYVAGGTVRVDGRIEGDLFVAGGTIDVTGPVTGDLFVAGGTVRLNAPVGRHLRVAGGDVSVNGPVQLDLLAGAGTLRVGSASRVEGDLIFSAGQMNLDGAVAGSVLGSAQAYTKAGTVGGTEEVDLRPTTPAPRPTPSPGARLLDQLQRYVGIVVVGGLLVWLAPQLIGSAASSIRERPLPTLGVGLLGFASFFPIMLALLAAMVLVAIPLGLLGLGRLVFLVVAGVLLGSASLSFVFLVLLLLVAAAVVGLSVGQFTADKANLTPVRGSYMALLLGVLVVVVLTAIPVIGWVLNAVVVLLGLGALIFVAWRQARSRVAPVPAAPAGGTS